MDITKRFVTFWFALLAFTLGVWADEVDPTTQLKYTVSNNEVTVTGFADDFTPNADYALVIPDEIDGMPVVEVGNAAFLDNTVITSVYIGKNVKTIGAEAFRRAIAIKSVTFAPDGVVETFGESAFRGLAEMTEFVMPNTVKSIGDMALQANAKLESVTLSNQLTVLSKQALCNCPLLKTVEIPNSIKEIKSLAFWMSTGGLETITIPSSVTTIASDAFQDCNNLREATFYCPNIPANLLAGKTNLETLVIGSGVKTIYGSAFKGCTSLSSISIPASVTVLSEAAFQECTGLVSATFDEGTSITELPKSLFYGCSALSNFTIPTSVNTIGEQAFMGCSQLEDIVIPVSVTSIQQNAFKNCSALETVTFAEGIQLEYILGGTFRGCSNLVGIDIPASVRRIEASDSNNGAFQVSGIQYVNFAENCILEYIGTSTFRGCARLTSFVMPNSVKEIGEMVLQANANLASVTISNQLKVINNNMVCNCPMLTQIDIPSSVTTINNWAFYLCTGLSEITIPHNVHTLGDYIFKDCSSNLTIDLSACTNVWELYNGNTNVTTKYSVPNGATVILPPGSNATGTNIQETDLGTLAQDSEGYYLIGSVEDFNKFAAIVRGTPTANARLTADIVLDGDEMTIGLGIDQNNCIAYGGTFDGQGHTITLNYTDVNKITRSYIGLFSWTDGATIQNLAVDGALETTQPKVGGIVSGIKGTLTVQNCKAAVTITGIIETPTNMHLGGMLGYTHNADITLTDCMACGRIQGGSNVKCCSDFFGRITNGTKVTLNNNLAMEDYDVNLDYIGRVWICETSNPTENYVGANNIFVSLGQGQSTGGGLGHTNVNITSRASLEEVADGTVAILLQNGREESIWVQDPVTNRPALKIFASWVQIKGDVNQDGDVTIADVTTLVNIILNKSTDYDFDAADVDGNDSVDIGDVTTLVNIILGKQ